MSDTQLCVTHFPVAGRDLALQAAYDPAPYNAHAACAR